MCRIKVLLSRFVALAAFAAELMPATVRGSASAGSVLNLIHPLDRPFPGHPFQLSGHDKAGLSQLHLSLEMLFVPDHNNLWSCRICDTFPSFDNKLMAMIEDRDQPYDLKISLRIRDDVFWGNGLPVTGRDFYFTWQLAKKIPGPYPGKPVFSRIKHVVVDSHDPRQFTVFLGGRHYFDSGWGYWFILPQALEDPLWKKSGGDLRAYFASSNYMKDPFNPGLWSGPYLPDRSSSAGLAVLVPNPFSALKDKRFKKIEVSGQPLSASGGQRKHLIFSEIACRIRGKCPQQGGAGLREFIAESHYYEQITLNLRNPMLRDLRVRRALRAAIPRGHIFDTIYQGEVTPAWRFFPSSYPWFDKDVDFREFDEGLAGKVLDQSEWLLRTVDGSRVRMKQGKPLQLSLVTNRERRRIQTAEYLVRAWRRCGIDVKLELQDQPKFAGQTLRKLNFSGMAMFAWEIPLDLSLSSLFASSSIPTVRNDYQGQNLSAWSHRTTEQLLEKLRVEFDFQRRKALLIRLQKQYVHDIPSIPLFYRLNRALVSKAVTGFRLPDNSFSSTLYAAGWAAHESTL